MNEKRLLRLAELLEAHADNGIRFDLGCWRTENSEMRNWCGTKACAVGLAMGDRAFKRQGLKTALDEFTGLSYPVFDCWDGMSAARRFFDLEEEDDGGLLFYPEAYTGKTHGDAAARKVAKRIRAYIADPDKVRAKVEVTW